ncbi:hypothetical protein TeGR_g1072, partial [Tetraparma gracilis]
MYPSIVVETALRNARKKESDSHQTVFDREAITFSMSVSRHWASTNKHFNPFFELLRDSIVDFGGELLSCSPLSTTTDDTSDGGRGSLIITGVFLTGELPVRQSGGSKNHVEMADAMSHFAAFMYYLLQDESFSDATDIQEDGLRSKSINAISAYANEWLRKGVAPVLTKTLTEGDLLSLAHSGCSQSSIIAAAFSISDASNLRANLGQLRTILDLVAKEFGEHGGGVMSSTTSSNSLQIIGSLPVPLTSAAFFVSLLHGTLRKHSRKIAETSKKKGKELLQARPTTFVIHFGDILWRAGVGGSVIPYGPEVDEVTAQFQLLQRSLNEANNSSGGRAPIYCKASVVEEQLDLSGESRLIKFTDSPEHPEWKVPHDIFSEALSTVFVASEMSGRTDIRLGLSRSLQELLLINASSNTLLEARAGFGKSTLANEIVQIAASLKIPHFVARASQDNESNLRIWIELCAALLRTAAEDGSEDSVDLLDHLPSACGITQLYWLNDFLPARYRVTEAELRVEHNDDSDDDAEAGGLLHEEDHTHSSTANASVKLQLFGNLLHSLALLVAPFVFVIEDLQWLDSSSWKMLVQSEHWTHGLMMVCTTRPVPMHVADYFTSVCRAPTTKRVILGPLGSADLVDLACFHLAEVGVGPHAMPSVIERLVKLSEGFPFLAEELLREAKVELASSMLGSSREPAALRDAGSSTKRSTVSTDPYTDDELVALNEFYSTYKRNSGWELFKVTDGVEYFSRPGEGNIRQSKASCIIPNATPHDLLDTIVEEISEQLLKLIETRTGGNLLYIQELVSSLIESGMLKYNEKSVDLKSDVDDLVVPDNVQAVIASRLAGLTTSQQSILQTASVIGRTFTLGMVTEVHPASEMLQNLAGDLKEIVRKRLVERIVGGVVGGERRGAVSDGELQFSHKFVQESIYESCLLSNRKQVHKAIAKFLELDRSKQLSDNYALIAHHYVQAEEWRNACLYLQLSGDVKFAALFGSVVAPMLGLTRVSEHLTMEANRLATQCTGKDGVVASASLNFANGMAYGGKGELRQSAGFFTAAAKSALEMRDLNEWANNTTFSLFMTYENGNLTQVLEALHSVLRKAQEAGSPVAIRTFSVAAAALSVNAGKEDKATLLQQWKQTWEDDVHDRSYNDSATWTGVVMLKWNMGEITSDECAKAVVRRYEISKHSTSNVMYTTGISSNALCMLQLYDYAEAAGADTLGGVKVSEFLRMTSFYASYLEKLAKTYPLSKGWAHALRGAVLARIGKLGAAMQHFNKAEEASLKISGKACLCYTLLELG